MINTLKLTSKLIILVFFISGISSCGNDDDCCVTPGTPSGDVWIVNEGNFLQGNSSLTVYNRETMVVDSSVFQLKNNRGLGDIFQSITFHENKAYLIINNSERIEVVNSEDFSLIKTITNNVYSPRYGVILNDKMYVSDIRNPYLYIIDVITDEVVDSIFTTRPVEELIVHDNLIFGSGSDFFAAVEDIVVIDPTQKKVIANIPVGKNPNAMIKDAAGMIWVVCDGVYSEANSASVYRINATSRTVDKSMTFDSFTPQFPTRLATNQQDPKEIFINGPLGIYKINMTDISLPTVPFLNFTGSTYALGIDPDTGNYYIGDAVGFSGNGKVTILSPTGDQINTFKVGIGPNRFYFR